MITIKKIISIILLLIIFSSYPAMAISNKTLSTTGLAQLELTPDQAIIKVKIIAEGKNKAQTSYQLKRKLKNLKEKLIANSEISSSSYIENDKYQRNKLYRLITQLEIKINNFANDKLKSALLKVFNTIKDENPAKNNVSYNQATTINYKIDKAYYKFKDAKQYQKKLLALAFKSARNKAKLLAQISNLNLGHIYKIKENSSTDLKSYQQRIKLSNPSFPSKRLFEEEITLIYLFN